MFPGKLMPTMAPDRLPLAAADLGQPQTPGSPRFAELEAYRGIAALLIVVYHVYQYARAGNPVRFPYEGHPIHVALRNLEAPVAWFFVLSGFLIFLRFARVIV